MANWMGNAVKRKGALTKKAEEAGETPMQFARQHAHESGPRGSAGLRTGEEARAALIMQGEKIPPKKGGRRGHAHLPRSAARR